MKLHQSLLAALVLIVTTTGLEAGVILTVDVTDPANVVFTSTAEESQFAGTASSLEGITLIDFFSTGTANKNSNSEAGSIDVFETNTNMMRAELDEAFIGDSAGGWTTNHLNLYHNAATNAPIFTMEFFTNQRALAGSVTHELSSQGSDLPSIGESGDIVVGLPLNDNVIGRWQVIAPAPANSVPEPGTFGMLLSSGLLVLAASGWRQRRRESGSNNG